MKHLYNSFNDMAKSFVHVLSTLFMFCLMNWISRYPQRTYIEQSFDTPDKKNKSMVTQPIQARINYGAHHVNLAAKCKSW